MESKLARQVEQALIDDVKRLTHEERLEAFITHCRLMMDLYLAGEERRARGGRLPNRGAEAHHRWRRETEVSVGVRAR